VSALVTRARTRSLRRQADGLVVSSALEMADTFLARTRGLMGRARLAPEQGLWLEPCSSIHMMFMRFSIDVVFGKRRLEDDGVTILKVSSGVWPWIGLAFCIGADVAIELPAGRAEQLGLVAGDVLETTARGAP
jgi:uncharacterized protein